MPVTVPDINDLIGPTVTEGQYKTKLSELFATLAAKAATLDGDAMLGALEYAAEASVASATTCNIGAATSNRVQITGTTTITGLGTGTNKTRLVRFAAALTLTHNATSLILPGAANITTAAGDTAIFSSDGSGNWRCLSYQKANGQAVVSTTVNTAQLCKAWVNFTNVTTTTIRDSFNVSSLTDNGTGNTTINFSTAMGNTNYSFIGAASPPAAYQTSTATLQKFYNGTMTTSAIQVLTTTNQTGIATTDTDFNFAAIFSN